MDMTETKANSVFRAGPPNNMQMGHVVYVSSQTSKKVVSGQNEAYGSMQIIIAFVHIGPGGILLYSVKDFAPLSMICGYPFWGRGLGKNKVAENLSSEKEQEFSLVPTAYQ